VRHENFVWLGFYIADKLFCFGFQSIEKIMAWILKERIEKISGIDFKELKKFLA